MADHTSDRGGLELEFELRPPTPEQLDGMQGGLRTLAIWLIRRHRRKLGRLSGGGEKDAQKEAETP